jgi:hypothetical protein
MADEQPINVKAAIILLADTETKESLARMVNALMTAGEFKEAGDEVRLVLDGAGVKWAAELSDDDHKYHGLFQKVRDRVSVCKYCAKAFKVSDAVEAAGLDYADQYKDHPSLRELAAKGYQIITF